MIGVVRSGVFAGHRSRGYHPERPERADAVWEGFASGCRSPWEQVPLRPASVEELGAVHTEDYVDAVLAALESGWGHLDPDTYFSPQTAEAARAAAGTAADLAAAVHAGRYAWGLAIVRPPGHHATRNRAGGFCIFNNAAVAAQTLRARCGAARVAIVDVDVHHGNGTQDIFWDRSDVLYVSLHQWPHYPGSGRCEEVGRGDGEGFTVNVPLPAGCGDGAYHHAFAQVVLPVLQAFSPEHVVVSLGFDAYAGDPLAGMAVTPEGFGWMLAKLRQQAAASASGRLTAVLEGGYDLDGLRQCTAAVTRALEGDDYPDPPGDPQDAAAVVARAQRILAPYWPAAFPA